MSLQDDRNQPHAQSAEEQEVSKVIDESGKPKRRTTIYVIIAVAIGLLVNIFITLFLNSGKLQEAFQSFSIWLLIVPFLLYLFTNVLDALRTVLVSRTCGHPTGFMTGLSNSIIGHFFSNISPLSAGGQAVQVVHFARRGMPSKIATNIILSRFVVNGMILMAAIAFGIPLIVRIGTTMHATAIVLYIGLTTTFIFALFFLAILIQPRIISWLTGLIAHRGLGRFIGRVAKKEHWHSDLDTYMTDLRREIKTLWSNGFWVMMLDILLNILTIVVQGVSVWYTLYVLAGPAFDLVSVLVTFIVIWQVVFYIPSPGASGGLEGMLTLVFATISGQPEKTFAAIVLWRIGTYYLHLILGAIVSSYSLRKPKTVPMDGASGASPQNA